MLLCSISKILKKKLKFNFLNLGKLPEQKHLKGGVVFIPKVPRARDTGVVKRNLINKILSKYVYVDEKVVDKAEAEESMKASH